MPATTIPPPEADFGGEWVGRQWPEKGPPAPWFHLRVNLTSGTASPIMRTCLTHLLLSPALFILFVLVYFYHWIIASHDYCSGTRGNNWFITLALPKMATSITKVFPCWFPFSLDNHHLHTFFLFFSSSSPQTAQTCNLASCLTKISTSWSLEEINLIWSCFCATRSSQNDSQLPCVSFEHGILIWRMGI
jgi:hypothetical protein